MAIRGLAAAASLVLMRTGCLKGGIGWLAEVLLAVCKTSDWIIREVCPAKLHYIMIYTTCTCNLVYLYIIYNFIDSSRSNNFYNNKQSIDR